MTAVLLDHCILLVTDWLNLVQTTFLILCLKASRWFLNSSVGISMKPAILSGGMVVYSFR